MMDLDLLLKSRDARAAHQKELLGLYPGTSLVCLTVQLPGPVKRDIHSLLVGGAGLEALLNLYGSVLRHVQVRDLETGYEAYLLVPLPAPMVKRQCCRIEDTHPLGRLMDVDVLSSEGPVSRESLGIAPRKCLLCDREVRYCMRARTHTLAELLERIHTMTSEYLKNSPYQA